MKISILLLLLVDLDLSSWLYTHRSSNSSRYNMSVLLLVDAMNMNDDHNNSMNQQKVPPSATMTSLENNDNLVSKEEDADIIPPLLSNNGASSFTVSSCSVQGNYRDYMEDEIFVSEDGRFLGVFDGHGGGSVSRYLRQNLFAITLANLKNQQYQAHEHYSLEPNSTSIGENSIDEGNSTIKVSADHVAFRARTSPSLVDFHCALKTAFRIIDEAVQRVSHWSYQGSCAVCCILVDVENSDNNEIDVNSENDNSPCTTNRRAIIANIGDSRAVLGRSGTVIPLSIDHKPNRPMERKRIEACGGSVKWCGAIDSSGRPVKHTGIYRVNGNLAISRAIGDRAERPHVCSEVDIFYHDLQSDDEFIVLASDGLWDVISSHDVVSFIHDKRPTEEGKNNEYVSSAKRSRREPDISTGIGGRENIARDLCELAIRLGSTDNISVIIVWLH